MGEFTINSPRDVRSNLKSQLAAAVASNSSAVTWRIVAVGSSRVRVECIALPLIIEIDIFIVE